VKSVDYSGDKVVVSSENGQKWTADKVIITVPLSLLQKSVISFTPSLPEHKVKAFHKLGTGVTEKIALQFPERFWQNKAKRAGFFGHVPSDESQRGLFSMFYDLTPKDNPSSPFVLISQLSGKAVEVQREKTDEEIVKCCVGVLGKLFPEKPIPEPEKWFVTRWHSMENIGMAYSYVPIGSGGDTYDIVAEDVDQRVFFGGEATHRQFPQTVTGAYLSGVREAAKIITLPDTVES
ncbi:lysine-specific histone demethylase 1B-like, partial [Lingula anatina]|uniref:Lysine-specific histone demethylase 1B-like n=1 Tax=Lingula anatina TaxID=7574 RepID=A0A1S3IHE5_LINAN